MLPPNTHLPPPTGQLPGRRAAPPLGSSAALATPTPGPVPAAIATVPRSDGTAPAGAAPAPLPTAFAQTNVFTFGSAPQSNFAKPADPVQIFFATLSPTVVSNSTSVRVAVITTSNASAVKLQIGTQTIGLSQTGAGQWQAAFPFPIAAVPAGQTSVTAVLTASRADGSSASIPIPLNAGSS